MSFLRQSLVALLLPVCLSLSAKVASAQVINQAIGGVRVDGQGALQNLTQQERQELAQLRLQEYGSVPADFAESTPLRKVSLRGVLDALAKLAPQSPEDVPPELAFLGGLTRVQYVFVYPEQNDIVLAGPAEAWKVTESGEVVGAKSGKPFVRLEDLIAALAATSGVQSTGVTCSIEPTADGLRRLEALSRDAVSAGSPEESAQRMAETVGAQQIKLGGCDPSSHFAQVLAAADYRMKRLAMKLDPAAVRELPSFMDLAARARLRNMMPRWWMADNYESLARDKDGLAWELKGVGVKTLSEEDFFANGERKESRAAHPLAKKWADMMTEHFEELAAAEPIFGELRNCMDLSVIAALIHREKLAEKCSFDLGQFLNAGKPCCRSFSVPTTVASEASLVRQSKGWLVSVSGGVDVDPYKVAANQRESADIAAVRQTAANNAETATWFWN